MEGYKYIVEDDLNSGRYGDVYLVTNNDDKKKYTLKKQFFNEEGNKLVFHNEIEILLRVKELPESNLLFQQIEEWWENADDGVIVSKFAEGTDIFDCCPPSDSEQSIQFIETLYKFLLKILNTLHGAGIYHRDIKTENIIYDPKTKRFSLIDFGLSYDSCSGKEPITIITQTEEENLYWPPFENYTLEDIDRYHASQVLLDVLYHYHLFDRDCKNSLYENTLIPHEIRQFIISSIGEHKYTNEHNCTNEEI